MSLQAFTYLSTSTVRFLRASGFLVVAGVSLSACSWVPEWAGGEPAPVASAPADDMPFENGQQGDFQADQTAQELDTAPAETFSNYATRPEVRGLIADRNRDYQEVVRAEEVETDVAFAEPEPEPASVETAQVPTPAPDAPTPEDQSELFKATFNTGTFNQLPAVVTNGSTETIVVSGSGVQRVGAGARGTMTPVASMPAFSQQLNTLGTVSGPITISSRGINQASVAQHQGQGQFVSTASRSSAFGSASRGGAQRDDRAALIYFDTGSTRLDQKSRSALQAFADVYKQRGGIVRIVGHASQRTRDMAYENHLQINFDVSLGRAHEVGEYLVRMGVPANAIVVEAKGASDPEYLEIMPSGEARNRRVELFLDQG